MTNEIFQANPFSRLAAGAPSPHASATDASPPGALLRAVLAGIVALLVLLLPSQLARGDDALAGCGNGVCAIADRAALDSPPGPHRTGTVEIRRRDIC